MGVALSKRTCRSAIAGAGAVLGVATASGDLSDEQRLTLRGIAAGAGIVGLVFGIISVVIDSPAETDWADYAAGESAED